MSLALIRATKLFSLCPARRRGCGGTRRPSCGRRRRRAPRARRNAALVRRGIEAWSHVGVQSRRRFPALPCFRLRWLPVRSGRLCALAVRRFLGQAECAQALRIGANGKLLSLVLVHRQLRIPRALLLRRHGGRALLRGLHIRCHGSLLTLANSSAPASWRTKRAPRRYTRTRGS